MKVVVKVGGGTQNIMQGMKTPNVELTVQK
jgi:hypothetical protein